MPIDRNRILDQFNTQQILGSHAGDDNRNPTSISQNTSGPYNITQLVYPEDLTNRADLQHFIVFYINIRGKTKFKPEKIVDVDVSSRSQNRGAQGTQQATAVGGAAVAAAAATAAGQIVGRATNSSIRGGLGDRLKILTKRAAKGAVPGVVGVTAAVATASLQQLSGILSVKEPQRVSDAIMLPIEGIPSVKYSMNYKDFDFGMIGGLMGGSSAVDSTVGGRIGEGLQAAVAGIGNLAKGVPGLEGLGDKTVNAAKLAAKVATNPFREVLFEGINYRTFNFSYTFLPKSKAETNKVRNIIDLFKFHMHPELSTNGLFYVYPSEFEMQYYFRGQQNEFLHKMSTCVLTDMSVDYGDGYFSSFDDGAPTEIKMSLTFKEVELLTKERIIKGF